MLATMKNKNLFARAVVDVIATDFEGVQQSFADACGLEKSILSKLINGREPNIFHLQKILPSLKRESSLALFSGWARDCFGQKDFETIFSGEVVAGMNSGDILRRNQDAENVLDFFRKRYMEDEEFLAWLLHLGRMMDVAISSGE